MRALGAFAVFVVVMACAFGAQCREPDDGHECRLRIKPINCPVYTHPICACMAQTSASCAWVCVR